MMFRMFCRSRSASVHCDAREDCAGAGASAFAKAAADKSAIVCFWTGASSGGGSGGGEGGSTVAMDGAGTGRDGGGDGCAGCGLRPIFSTARRMLSAPTFRLAGIGTGADFGVGRRIAGGAARGTRGIGTVAGRGCGRETGGFGGDGGGASSSDSGEDFSWDCCNLLQPLARLITTMISQISPLLSASLTMLAGRPGLAHVLSRD